MGYRKQIQRFLFLHVFFLSCMFFSAFAEEKSGLELPEVTILGKDVSEFQYAGSFTHSKEAGEKEEIRELERPLQTMDQTGKTSFKNFSTTAGRYGTLIAGADLGGMEKNMDYLFQMKYARTDGYRDHAEEELINPLGSVGIQLKNDLRVTSDFSFFHKQMDLPGQVTAPTSLATRENQSVDYEGGVELYPFPEQRLKASVFGTLSRTDEDPLEESFDDHFFGFSAEIMESIFKLGLEFWSEELENFYSYQKISGFAGVSGWEISPGLIWESLFCVDYYEGEPIRVDPKVSLMCFVTDQLSLSLNIYQKMKVRSWSESYLSEYYVEGNLTELRPQRTLGGDLTFSYLVKEGFTTSLAFFGEKVKNFYMWQDVDENGLFTLENHPEVSILGLRLELQIEIFKSLVGVSRFTFRNIQGEESGFERVPYVPELKGEWGLEWKSQSGFGVGTNLSYLGRQFVGPQGYDQIDEYVLWDMNGFYQWHNAKFFVKVLNVLDQRYDIFEGYPGPNTQYQFGVNLEF